MICGSVLLLAAPVAAQDVSTQTAAAATEAPPSQPTPTTLSHAQLDRLRADVGTFEIALERAINKAALELSQWVEQIVPGVPLYASSAPVAHGVPAGDASITFSVEVSEMVGVNMAMAYQRPSPQPPSPVERVGATGAQVLPGDPLTGPPSRLTPAAFDQHYSDYVRQGVIDTILDQSGVLALKDDQVLAVAVIPVSVTNLPGYKGVSRNLILSIKGGDLAQLRAGKISREEAKKRIVETHF
jgi:hypothetical protein